MNTVNQKSEIPLRILKIAHCPSVSGKSTLTYQIGCTAAGEIHLRIYANTAAGMFSQEWVSWTAIENTLSRHVTGFTSAAFRSLIQGKSQNNAGFLLAVLLQEQLVIKEGDQKRSYTCLDSGAFLDQINRLMASNVSLKADDNPKPENPKPSKPKAVALKKPRELNSPVHSDRTCIRPSPTRPANSNITRRCNTDRIPTPAESQAFQGLMQKSTSPKPK
jgi:hypothetical protein